MSRLLLALPAVVFFAGCGSPAPPAGDGIPDTAPLEVASADADTPGPAVARAEGAVSPRGAAPRDTVPRFAWVTDSVAARLDLPLLRSEELRSIEREDGRREVRVWTGFGIVIPHGLLRLVETEDGVRGAAYLWWSIRPGDEEEIIPDLARLAGGPCHLPPEAGVAVCRVEHDPSLDWEALLRDLERHRLFDLPDPSTLGGPGSSGVDGFTLVVEVLDGRRYHTYAYWSPWDARWPEARDAAAIADRVLEVGRR